MRKRDALAALSRGTYAEIRQFARLFALAYQKGARRCSICSPRNAATTRFVSPRHRRRDAANAAANLRAALNLLIPTIRRRNETKFEIPHRPVSSYQFGTDGLPEEK